ncbi:pyruvate kinase [Caulobacter sp. KR2-114]|uniref:pyruvate kinase n=1 Tax=Caulobacter sp. KR2-114 TaxID=3400912 RepID=UPI003C0A9403
MIRNRRTRIVATLGPASRAPDMVRTLAQAGVDVFRLNFSHGTHDDHQAALNAVRAAEAHVGRPLAALADLQGPKFRLGAFAKGRIAIAPGQAIRLDGDAAPGDGRRAPLPHPEVLKVLRRGMEVVLDDGKVRLRVTDVADGHVDTEVVCGDALSDRKGVSVPGATIPVPALTAKDRKDLDFALRIGVDWIALSFVQHAGDVAELRRLVNGRAQILSKIEKPAAIEHLEAILDVSDGLMVARGDLGVEMATEEVPVAQKTIVRAARRRGAPVIIATQMLESMTASPSPTRAEASDVANGVYEGADALMLSAESASGAYPREAVTVMDAIIRRVEADPNWPSLMRAEHGADADEDVDALIAAATRAAQARSTACLVAYTTTGSTARRVARERPILPVLAIAPNEKVARQLGLVWGLEPRVATQPRGIAAMTDEAAHMAAELGLAAAGARVLIIAGPPMGAPGAANLLRIAHAPRTRGS